MAAPLRILHLEDNPNDAELVSHMLIDNDIPCVITRVDTGEDFKEALERDRFELILSDYNLPTLTGLDALKLAAKLKPGVPFLFVSGVMGEEFAVMTLQLGATDYVLKKNLARLPSSVRRALNEAEATATRVRMEESLRLHATRMKSIMDTSLDAIVVMDSRGLILDWNAQAEAVFGWRKAEVLGRLVADTIIPPQHREAHAQGLTRFMATGEGPVLNRRIEITALHRTGREFPIELAVTATKLHDQWQFTAFIIDNTRRKQAERRLAAQYAVAQVLAEAASLEQAGTQILRTLCDCLDWEMGALWMVDRDANLLRCLDLWHVPQVDAVEFAAATRARTFASGVGMPGRVWSSGEPAWIPDVLTDANFPRAPVAGKAGLHSAVGFPIRIARKVYGIIEFFSREIRAPDTELMNMVDDIGLKIGQFVERTRADEALRQSEERFKIIFDQAPMGIAMIDSLTGRIYTVNDRFAQIAGRTVEEMTRIDWMSITHPDDVQADLDNMALLNAGEITGFQMEKRYLLPSGDAVWINMTIAPVKQESDSRRRHLCMIEDITERKKAEEALKDSEQRYKLLVDHANDIIYRTDPRGRLTYVNPTATRIMQYSDEELLRMRFTDLIRPDQRREVERFYGRQFTDKDANTYNEFPAIRKDGTEIWLGQNVQQLFEDGKAVGFQAVARDITERKRADHASRQLAAIVESSNDAIVSLTLDGIVTSWNHGATRLFGYSPAEMVGQPIMILLPPDRQDEEQRIIASLKRGERVEHYETVRRPKDGHLIHVSLTASPIRDESGTLIGFSKIVRDITERKEAEEALRHSQEMLRATWEHTPLMMFLKDREGRYLDFNTPFLQLTGRPREQVLGRTDEEIFQRSQALAFRTNDLKVLESNQPMEFEEVAEHPDGPHTSIVFKFPLRNAAGLPYAVGGIVADITERRQIEELRLARLSAEQANQTKSEFLSRMSHELRTPLNAVLGFAQLMEMDTLSPEHREHVQQILKGGRHLLALVNEVLDIARIEAGRLSLSLEPVPVATIVVEAVDLIRPQAAARRIRLVLPPADPIPIYVRAEFQRLKQVLVNLLSNGVKYNREDGTLTIAGQVRPGSRYRLTVTDTGDGIPAAMMSRLFTPFDRLDADSRTEGTGLGLALSRSLVTAMGGAIFVESTVGQGTTISVDLPLAEAPTTRLDAQGHTTALPAPPPTRPMTILYIEDNQANFLLVEQLLQRRPGVQLIGAMQGTLGIELAASHRPDLILLDLNLPDIQGDEVLLRLRERPETAGIPVAMLSADAMQKQVDKLLAGGAQRYLTKPIDVGQFYALLDEFLTKKGGS